jgi:DNA-directed RNA polymerase subunit RPC12/RpoP
MVQIRCPECGWYTVLDAFTYWDVEDMDVTCTRCKARLTITLQKGQLKKMKSRKPETSEV